MATTKIKIESPDQVFNVLSQTSAGQTYKLTGGKKKNSPSLVLAFTNALRTAQSDGAGTTAFGSITDGVKNKNGDISFSFEGRTVIVGKGLFGFAQRLFTSTPADGRLFEVGTAWTAYAQANPPGPTPGPTPTPTPGQAFTLTTNVDTIPGMIGSNGTSSTAGDVTINSVLAGTNSTLNIFDTINAGTGVNTININTANTDPAALGFANIPLLTNLQKVNLQNYDFDGGVAFDASVAPQITTLGLVRQLGDGSFTTNNALGTLNAFVINNLQLDDTDIDVNYTAGQLAGAADAVAVALTDVKAATVDEDNSTEISLDGGAVGQGFETVNLTVTSESRLGDLLVRDSGNTSTIKTLNVSGAGSLRIFDALDFKDTTGTINASSSTGEVWLRVGTETITYTGGSGNDRLDFEAVGDFNNSDVIKFGGGINTIGLDDTTYSTELYALINGVSTAQRLALLDGAGATIDMSKLTLNTIVISNAASNANKGDNKITKLTAADTVIIDTGFANVDVNLDGSLGFNTANIVLAGTSTASVSVDNLDLLLQATINITSNGSNAGTANTVTDLNNTAASVITVTGSQAVTFTEALAAAAVVNASAATGALTVIGADAASSIAGGSAADVIALGTLAGGDTVVGGAGADTITTVNDITGTTATVITPGLGADTVNVQDANNAIAKITYNATAAESYAAAGQSDLLAFAAAVATDDMIVTFNTGKTSTSLTTSTTAAFVLGTTTVNSAGGFLWVNASGVATVEDENAVLYQDTNSNGLIDSTDFAARMTLLGADTFKIGITAGQAVVTFEGEAN